MSSPTTETATQRGPVTNKAEREDALKNKIIEHFCQLTLDPAFKNASATYSQVKEQQVVRALRCQPGAGSGFSLALS
jgi:hypothetical protein